MQAKMFQEVPMNKLILRISIALVAVATVFMVSGAAGDFPTGAANHGDVSGFCSDNDDFGMSHGECVAIGEANVNALAGRGISDGVAICKILEEVFGPFNFGQCVIHYR
jgi:hypothetical protein